MAHTCDIRCFHSPIRAYYMLLWEYGTSMSLLLCGLDGNMVRYCTTWLYISRAAGELSTAHECNTSPLLPILLVSLKKQSILQQAHTHTLRWEHAGFMAYPQSLLPLYHCSSILIDSVLVSRFLSQWYWVPNLLTYGVFTTSAASRHFYMDSYGVNRIHPTKKQLKRSRKACT